MENIQYVFMRLFPCKLTACMSETDSTSTVLVSVTRWASLSFEKNMTPVILPGNNGVTQLHLTTACVAHNVELRKTTAAL